MTEDAILKKPYIKSPYLKNIFKLFDKLRETKIKFDTASCMLITGESGSGKSQIAKHYVEKNPHVEQDERTYIPVLHYELESVSTEVQLLRSLLIAVGDPRLGEKEKNAVALLKRFVFLSKAIGLELLILDEIQVIMERRSQRVLSGLADLFKDIINRLEIPVVFMGMPWSRYLIESNEQLNGRISYKYTLYPYRVSDDSFDDYKRFLKLLAIYYQFDKSINFEDTQIAWRFFSFSQGNIRKTVELMRQAYIVSILQKTDIRLATFATVVRDYGMTDDKLNMFLIPVDKLKLKELTCHSDWDFTDRANKNSIIVAEYTEYIILKEEGVYRLKSVA